MSKHDVLDLDDGEIMFFASWYTITSKGLTITCPEDEVDWEMSRDLGRRLGKLRSTTLFAIADYCRFMEYKWGEKWTQLSGLFPDYSLRRLMNIQWTGNKVEKSRRRDNPNISFEHHSAVAALPPDDQDRMLNAVEHKKMERDNFRQYVKSAQKENPELQQLAWQRYAIDAAMTKIDIAIERIIDADLREMVKVAQSQLSDVRFEITEKEHEVQRKLREAEEDDERVPSTG